MKIKKTLALTISNSVIKRDKVTKDFLRLEYAFKRSADAVKPFAKTIQQEIDGINLDNALVVAGEVKFDKDGAGGFAYSKQGEAKRRKAVEALLEEEIEVPLYTIKYFDAMKEVSGIEMFFGTLIEDAPAAAETEEEYLKANLPPEELPKPNSTKTTNL